LISGLREQAEAGALRRQTTVRQPLIPSIGEISERPVQVKDRAVPDHREDDWILADSPSTDSSGP
jgi:hypothetical protein